MNRAYCTVKFDGIPGTWVPAEQHDELLKELWECYKASGADYSHLVDYERPWEHMTPGLALGGVEELRRDYSEACEAA